MKKISVFLLFYIANQIAFAQKMEQQNNMSRQEMMIRIAEIEVFPEFLEVYNTILKEEAAASINIESGVISIFPMYEQENPTHIKIVEIYADTAAYQSHLKTLHFLHYKTTTLKMVKSLKLISMGAIDKTAMMEIFRKMK